MTEKPILGKLRARLYVAEPLAEGSRITLKDGQAHYLIATLRVREGERVALFNGQDGEWVAVAESITKREVGLQVEQLRKAQKGCPDIALYFAPVKNEKIDFLVKRAVELGVSAVCPVMTRYTVVSRVNMERLSANAIEAAEQCGRLDIPYMSESRALMQVLDGWDSERILLFCDEAGQGRAVKDLLPTLSATKYAVLIGPEGGFAPEEREMLRSLPFVRGLSLGSRILRAETAALAALVCVQAWVGDWSEQPAFEAQQ